MSGDQGAHRIIVVGGGAGGLELATRLGRRLGRRGRAAVTLADRSLTHLWKPLLHEVAAGRLDSYEDELNYLAHAHWNHLQFRLGALESVDRRARTVTLAPSTDPRVGEFVPRRTFAYDTLVIAIGSTTNDFGVEGVREHCWYLDSREQADEFQRHFLRLCYMAETRGGTLTPGQLDIAIVGAGATGVELAAELQASLETLHAYGLEHVDPQRDVTIHLIEAADRILPGLSPRVTESTTRVLTQLGIRVHTGMRIAKADADGLHTADGTFIPAGIRVWCAGIRAPEVLAGIEGLETNAAGQLVVRPTLQTTRDDAIFAFGDCAACPQPDGSLVPPRAQAAHQQASLLARSLPRRIAGASDLPQYVYRDFGSLISLSRYSAVGQLMGNLFGRAPGRLFIEGALARMAYQSLYKMHQVAVLGPVRTALLTLADLVAHRARPRLKLH